MKHQTILSLLLLLPFSLPAFSEPLERDRWKKEFGAEVRDALCQDSSYFRRCFTVSPAECKGQAEKAYEGCFARYKAKIPKLLDEPAFKEWTSRLKACVGTDVAIAFDDAKRTLESEACDPQRDADLKMPRDIYLEQAAVSLPRDLCLEGLPHRTCYSVTEKECQAAMTKAARDCIPALQKELPPRIRISSSAFWIMDVATCASPRFDKALAAKRSKKDEYCRNIFARKK